MILRFRDLGDGKFEISALKWYSNFRGVARGKFELLAYDINVMRQGSRGPHQAPLQVQGRALVGDPGGKAPWKLLILALLMELNFIT